MKLSRKKWEHQTEPKAGTQLRVRAIPGKGLTGHFSLPLGPTGISSQTVLKTPRTSKHPDPAIDLAIMPVALLLKQADGMGFRFFFIPLAKDMLATSAELDELSPDAT